MGYQDFSPHKEVKCLSEVKVNTWSPALCIPLQCYLPSMTICLLPLWRLFIYIYIFFFIQFVITMPSTAQYNVGCSYIEDMELETLQNPSNSKFEATCIAMGQSPSGCGTVQMKLQEHRMASHSHMFNRKSRGSEREPADQTKKP